MCYRCTRFQAEIPGDEALAALDRGGTSEIGMLQGETFDSLFSGNTIELCPVGALTSRQYRFRGAALGPSATRQRLRRLRCRLQRRVHSRDGHILRIVARENREVNDGWLCDYGRFETLPAAREQRVRQPMVRRGRRSSRPPATRR